MKRIHDKLGTAGLIVAVVALIAALGGSAIAAGTATDSAKRNNRKGNAGAALAKKYAKVFSQRYSKAFAKRFTSAGPAGPQGPAGPAGPKGDNGANGSGGSNGTDGADGKTVLSGVGVPTPGIGSDGDFYIRTTTSDIYGPKTAGSWGAATSLEGAEGEEGSPWAVGGTLPDGSTETGAWFGVLAGAAKRTTQAVSFAVPLDAPLVSFSNTKIVKVGETPPAECDDGEGTAPGPENPEADSGFLCVFIAKAKATASGVVTRPGNTVGGGASRTGALISILGGAEGVEGEEVWGTFAVTG